MTSITEDVFWDNRPLWKKAMTRRAQKAAKITTGIKLSTKAEVKAG
jgi:hypothetical protein